MMDWFVVLWHKVPYCTFGRKSLCVFWKEAHILSYAPWGQSVYISYLEFYCMRDLSIPSYLFIESFIYISIDSWIFTLYLGYKPQLLYFSAQIVPALDSGSSFSCSSVFLWHSYSRTGIFWNSSLLSDYKTFQGHLAYFLLLSWIHLFVQEDLVSLIGGWYWKPWLVTRCAHCHWSFSASRFLSWQRGIYVRC